MPKTLKKWTVLPHGKLTLVDDDLLTVVGEMHMPLGDFPRGPFVTLRALAASLE